MFFGLFLGPVLATVLFNTVVFVIVLRVLIKHYLRKLEDIEQKKRIVGSLKTLTSVVSIMFMFGLQWLFGAFTIAQASEAFQWLFVIFSTLQGVFLFLYFCVLAQDAREQWLNLLTLGHRKVKKRTVSVSHSSQSHSRPHNQKNSSSTLTTQPDYSSNTLKRNVLLASPPSSRTNSVGEGSAVTMASRRNMLLALPTSINEEKETEFVITNGNVSDHDDGKSDTSEEIEKVDLSAEATTFTNTATHQPMVEVPPHILERRFRFHQSPPPAAKEVEKVDLSTPPPVKPTVRTNETMVEVPPHVLERRRSSCVTQRPAESTLSLLEKTEERSEEQDDDGSKEWEIDDTIDENFYDAMDFDFGDDLTELLNLSLADGDFSDVEEMTSNF